jgi:hypothetical protein
MSESKFNQDEIERERRKASRRNQNLDDDQLAQKAKLRRILEYGSLNDLNKVLETIGKAGTSEAEAIIAHFRRVRGL